MAIRFVDVGPADKTGAAEVSKPAAARRARPPGAHSETDTAPAPAAVEPLAEPDPGAQADGSAAEVSLPGLTHAKPEPKPRGRKKPMSAVGADKATTTDRKPLRTPEAPAAPLLDGLLPELQVHAKPTPKPRGRKKAFG